MEEPGNQVRSAGIKAHRFLEHRGQHQAAPALRRGTRQGHSGRFGQVVDSLGIKSILGKNRLNAPVGEKQEQFSRGPSL